MNLNFVTAAAKFYRDIFDKYLNKKMHIIHTIWFTEWLSENEALWHLEYKTFYNDNHDEIVVFDTATRDLLHDLLAQKMGFDHWPINLDDEEYKEKFLQALYTLTTEDMFRCGILLSDS